MLVDINLLPQKERERPAVIIAAVALLLAALLLWTVFFFMARSEENRQQALLAESQELAVLQTELREELAARSGLSEEQGLQATVTWAESYQYDTVPLLTELASLLPTRGFFQNFGYSGPNTATLEVQFDNSREAAFYLTHLKNSELLDDATLLSVQTEELGAEEEEDTTEEETFVLPRYTASYEIVFVDERIPAEVVPETVAGETPPAPAAPAPAAEPAPAEPAAAAATPTEEVPAND